MKRRFAGTFVAPALALVLSGCSGGDEVAQIPDVPTSPASPTESSASSTPTPSTEKEKALAQYNRWWKIETEAYNAPAEKRRATAEPVLTEPAMTGFLRGAAQMDRAGRDAFGTNVTRPKIDTLTSESAVVYDCQDSSRSGQWDEGTHAKPVVGEERHVVVASLQRGSDGVWRIQTLDFPEDVTC